MKLRERLTPYLLLGALTLGAGLGVGLGLSEASATSTAHRVATSPIKIRITLSETRVRSGTPIKGEAVITNTTFKTITVQTCALDGWLEVGLVNKQITFEPARSLVNCLPSVRLSPGPNRFPLTVSTSYQSCLQLGGQSTVYIPPCTSTGAPALPAGHYTTKVSTYGLPSGTPAALPISVTLLPTQG